MKNLVIVESPAKAKTISKFLGKNYVVKASVGHIRDLPKSKLGVDTENNFEPNYITIRGKAPIANELKKEAKKADNIYLATDPDREGEAISWHLAYILNLDLNDKIRIEFNEITEDKIKSAIKNPRAINMNLVNSQQARRILDRLVGYKISPILWNKIRRGLSAGRVQSVATRIICLKEKEIEEFEPEEYWSLDLSAYKDSKKNSVDFSFYGKKSKKIELKEKAQVDKIIHEIDGKNLKIIKIEKKNKKRAAYRPFITSTLQQEASSKLGFTAKKTMRIAQQLYEGINIKNKGTVGLITYMRTDSYRIANVFQESAQKYITEKYGKEYFKKYFFKNKALNVQDAHECIRPTSIDNEPFKIADSLSKEQFLLYNLIYKRCIAAMMNDAVFEALSVSGETGGYIFRANGSSLVFDGFMKVYDYVKTEEVILPQLFENDELKIDKVLPKQHFTQPPARYNEASLIKTLEELGIGRPSTYATIISNILDRGYVEKKQKALFPTKLGQTVNSLMEEYFAQVVNVGWTADIERKLDSIEDGNENWQDIVKSYYEPLEKEIEKADESIQKINMDEETDEICHLCGAKMVIKHGRYGKFLACSRYPDCKGTRPILNKTGLKCPKCKEGEVVIRKTKKGKSFYGCSAYPKCDFVSWNKPTGRYCEKCGAYMVEGTKKVKYKAKCSNPDCDYKEY